MLITMIEILNLPLIILNMGSGIIGGIWLAFLGEWQLIGIGVFLLFTARWLISLLLMVSLPLAAAAAHFYNKNNTIFLLFGFLSQLYTNLLIVGTCVLAFVICTSPIKVDVGVYWIPYLLWSWGMALGVWQFFASKEPDNEFSAITLFCASILYLLFLVSIFIGPLFMLVVLAISGLTLLLILPIFNMYAARRPS